MHLAGGNKGDDVAARNLVGAASRARVKHIVLISVIGADSVPIAWLKTRLEVEKTVEESGVPFTILRAAGTDRGVRTWEDFQAERLGRPAPAQAAAG